MCAKMGYHGAKQRVSCEPNVEGRIGKTLAKCRVSEKILSSSKPGNRTRPRFPRFAPITVCCPLAHWPAPVIFPRIPKFQLFERKMIREQTRVRNFFSPMGDKKVSFRQRFIPLFFYILLLIRAEIEDAKLFHSYFSEKKNQEQTDIIFSWHWDDQIQNLSLLSDEKLLNPRVVSGSLA